MDHIPALTLATADPRDLDGAGLYADVNRNGRIDIADVVRLFNSL